MKTRKTRKQIVHKLIVNLRRSYAALDKLMPTLACDKAAKSWKKASNYMKAATAIVIDGIEHEKNNGGKL